jgi:hypothetical protein
MLSLTEHNSAVHTDVKANGKNNNTIGLPMCSERVTACLSELVSVKSGAFEPMVKEFICEGFGLS